MGRGYSRHFLEFFITCGSSLNTVWCLICNSSADTVVFHFAVRMFDNVAAEDHSRTQRRDYSRSLPIVRDDHLNNTNRSRVTRRRTKTSVWAASIEFRFFKFLYTRNVFLTRRPSYDRNVTSHAKKGGSNEIDSGKENVTVNGTNKG